MKRGRDDPILTFNIPQKVPELVLVRRFRGEVHDHVLPLGKQLLHAHLIHELDEILPPSDEDVDASLIFGPLQDGVWPVLRTMASSFVRYNFPTNGSNILPGSLEILCCD